MQIITGYYAYQLATPVLVCQQAGAEVLLVAASDRLPLSHQCGILKAGPQLVARVAVQPCDQSVEVAVKLVAASRRE